MDSIVGLCLLLTCLISFVAPAFGNLMVESIQVRENSPIGSTIIDLKTLLELQQRLNQHTHVYASQQDSFRPFALRDFKIVLAEALDRESVCENAAHGSDADCPSEACCQILHVNVADDQTDLPHSFLLRIIVLDENDNRPIFRPPIENPFRAIREDARLGMQIDLPWAVDPDSLANSIVNYQIGQWSHGNRTHFEFGVRTEGNLLRPHLTIVRPLDREACDTYTFTLLAVDGGAPAATGTVDVTLTVTDVNDNKPSFDRDRYEAVVVENTFPQKLFDFHVIDADSPDSGRLHVSIRDKTGQAQRLFSVALQPNSNTFRDSARSSNAFVGALQVTDRLDAEKHNANISFELLARDNGSPELQTAVPVTVHVVNVNDHSPSVEFFSKGQRLGGKGLQLVENDTPVGAMVALVHVTDQDSSLASIQCRLASETADFLLADTRGNGHSPLLRYRQFVLRTRNPLDRENRSSYWVTVECSDADKDNPLSQNASLNIVVKDKNDNAPEFPHNSYEAHVPENAAQTELTWSASVAAPRAIDRDSGRNALINYSLADHPAASGDSSHFRVDSRTGLVYTVVPLDAETRKLYEFLLVATDDGEDATLSTNCTISVYVQDTNDNAPFFQPSNYLFEVKENEDPGTRFGRVMASDMDVDERNRRIKYRLKPDTETFALIEVDRETGELRTRQRLDHEKQASISVIVLAENEVHLKLADPLAEFVQAEATVMINVINLNDNRPEFQQIPSQPKHITFIWEQLAEPRAPIMPVEEERADNETARVLNNFPVCEQIPYQVVDRDQGLRNGLDDCCHLSLLNDFDGLFALMPNAPNVLCATRRPQHPKSYKVTLQARDGTDEHSLSSQVHLTVIIKSDPFVSENPNYGGGGGGGRYESLFNRDSTAYPTSMKHTVIVAVLAAIAGVFCLLLLCLIIALKKCCLDLRMPALKGPDRRTDNLPNQPRRILCDLKPEQQQQHSTLLRVNPDEELLYQQLNNFSDLAKPASSKHYQIQVNTLRSDSSTSASILGLKEQRISDLSSSNQHFHPAMPNSTLRILNSPGRKNRWVSGTLALERTPSAKWDQMNILKNNYQTIGPTNLTETRPVGTRCFSTLENPVQFAPRSRHATVDRASLDSWGTSSQKNDDYMCAEAREQTDRDSPPKKADLFQTSFV